MQDLFDAATTLGKLGIIGILSLDAIVVAIGYTFEIVVPGRSHRRQLADANARADRNLAGWEAAIAQYERSLDLIEKMQGRRRAMDATH